MKIKITFTEELLGTKPLDAQIFERFVNSKAPNGSQADETAAAAAAAEEDESEQEKAEKVGTCIFHRQDDCPGLWDYQIKGFFKDAARAMERFPAKDRNGLPKLPAHSKKLTTGVFVTERFVKLHAPAGSGIGWCQRPMVPTFGDVALMKTETLPAGTWMQFELKIFIPELEKYIVEFLKFGKFYGFGQWRSSGKGRFIGLPLE